MKKRIKVLKRLEDELDRKIAYHNEMIRSCLEVSEREYTEGLVQGLECSKSLVRDLISEENTDEHVVQGLTRRMFLDAGHC